MKSLFLSCFLTIMASASAFAAPCVSDTDCIPAGNDYFVTTPGTFFTIAGITVPLSGIPDPSNDGADTIVQRLQNIDVPDTIGATETVDTQLLELHLTGIDPNCPQGIGACNVTVSLDPANPSLGNLVFTQTVNGEATINPSCGGGTIACEGTFTSVFDVFFDLTFTTLGGAPLPCDANGDIMCLQPDLTLTGSGSWTDDNGEAFIVGGQVSESHPAPPGVHDAMEIFPPTTVPEPTSLALLATGLATLRLLSRRRRRSAPA